MFTYRVMENIWQAPNNKFQIPNKFQITMSEWSKQKNETNDFDIDFDFVPS